MQMRLMLVLMPQRFLGPPCEINHIISSIL